MKARAKRPARGRRVEVEVGGRRLVLKNLDKVFYPRGGVHEGRRHRLLRADRAGARSRTCATARSR